MKALIIGGTGIISTPICKRLVEQGWDLTILNRGKNKDRLPQGARLIEGDINDEAAIKEKLGDTYYDVIADFIVFTPEQLERDLRLFTGRCGQYIFISTASAYQKPPAEPVITESTPLYNPYWDYSQAKIVCEDRLMRACREDNFPVTIVRPSHTYNDWTLPLAIHGDKGPWQTVQRMIEGKPVVIHGDGTSLWTLTYSADFAPAFIGLMGNPHAIGHAFHITSDEALTWNQIYQVIGQALSVEPKIVHVSTDELVEHQPQLIGPLYGDKAHCGVFDNRKIKQFVPGFHAPTGFAFGARRVIETVLADPKLQTADPEWDTFLDQITAGKPLSKL